jgi:hypothetical protein
VDWLYRDLDRVAAAMADAREGHISAHYQPGHPHAFHSDMLMGEVHYGKLLWDPSGRLRALQRRTTP